MPLHYYLVVSNSMAQRVCVGSEWIRTNGGEDVGLIVEVPGVCDVISTAPLPDGDFISEETEKVPSRVSL